MKKLLVLGISVLIISCSGNEEAVSEDGAAFLQEVRLTNGPWLQLGQEIFWTRNGTRELFKICK